VIGLLPKLRLPWRKRPTTASAPAQTSPQPPTALPWSHRPPEPVERAQRCGQCGEDIPDSYPSMEICSVKCEAAWLAAHSDTIAKFVGPCTVKAVPEPVDPPWLAAIDDYVRKRAERSIAPRKSPTEEAA